MDRRGLGRYHGPCEQVAAASSRTQGDHCWMRVEGPDCAHRGRRCARVCITRRVECSATEPATRQLQERSDADGRRSRAMPLAASA